MTTDNPAVAVTQGVERTLELAATWLRWDGRPRVSEDGDRVYTPNKALRRHADHLIDHLAEIEAILSGNESEPDEWRGSLVTFPSDWAHFTEVDLSEAQQRLRRLAQLYVMRVGALSPEEWDAPRGAHWSIREIIDHVAPPWYAEQVGDLS
jgi:DNA-binding transcriptional MerR regulator